MQSCSMVEVLLKTKSYPVLIKVFQGRENFFFFWQYYFPGFVLPDTRIGIVIF